jgi:hypothetical protein
MMSSKLSQVFAAIDDANGNDPNRELEGGAARPAALLYGKRMSETLASLYPGASEALQIAARAQHIERWTIPRAAYPMDRAGYLRWRNRLKDYHAEAAARILGRAGYGASEVARVGSLLRKENLKSDPEAQALEDTACIVFLRFYASAFFARHDDAKAISILRKTWAKMSLQARAAALALPLEPRLKSLVAAALERP